MDEAQTQQRAMLAGKLVSELQAIAEQVGVRDSKKRRKADLIEAILGSVPGSGQPGPGHAGLGAPSNGSGHGGGYRRPGEGAQAPNHAAASMSLPSETQTPAGSTQPARQAGPAGESGNGQVPGPAAFRATDTPAAAGLPQRPAHSYQERLVPGPALPAGQALSAQPSGGESNGPRMAANAAESRQIETPQRDPAQAGTARPEPAQAGTARPEPAQAGTARPEPSGAASSGEGHRVGLPAEAVPAASGEAPRREGSSNGERSATSTVEAGGAAGSAQIGTHAPGAPATAPSGERPDYRRDGEGTRDRDRGRRRRRRERGGQGTDRPNERLERSDRLDRPVDRPERVDRMEQRMDRPRREPDFEDTADLEVRTGILDVLPEGYGFLRTSGYLPGHEDVYVSLSQVRKAQLRRGDEVAGAVRRPKEGEKYQALVRIDKVDGMAPEEIIGRKWFEKLTPLYPEERLHMELAEAPGQIAQRIIDLVAPIGKGQRGMIVSPPKAGKTTIMKQIANSITSNNPECHLIVLLVDERPEEVTDMQRSVKGEIVFSTFDRPSEDHIQVTELTLDRAKRLVELGQDVVILLDGITRLSRAYNLATPASGRILSGGVDSTALYPPKRFFGAARNIEQGGSLTVIATALVETGSRMDDVIFEEFKGTGNWELKLDRRASEKRIFPAIDIQASGTRKEELLLSPEELALVWKLRRVLHALEGVAALELLVDKMRQTKGNMQFLREIQKVQIGD